MLTAVRSTSFCDVRYDVFLLPPAEPLGCAAVQMTIKLRQTSDQPSAVRHDGPRSGKDPKMRNLTKDGTLQKVPCRGLEGKSAIWRHTCSMRLRSSDC